MTTVFHAWPYSRFIEIQSNLRRKKLHRTNQGCNSLGGSFSNRDNVRAPIQFRRKSQRQHVKRSFFHKKRPIFTSVAPVLLDQSDETSWVVPLLKPTTHFFHRSNQGSNFLGDSFSNRDNVKVPIQFRTESQPQHPKRWFFLKNRPIHFHVNSTSVVRLVKRSQLNFSSTEINNLITDKLHNVS